MEIAILTARILTLVYTSAGIAAISNRLNFSKISESFEKSQALTLISGFLSLIVGTILVTYHNLWVTNWTLIITIIGWITLLKGILLIIYPEFISFFKGIYRNNQIWGILMLIIGLIFGYYGFIK
jgi:uncharacterized membrane protein HdeD (DUF308 family)